MPLVHIKDFNALIVNRPFCDQPVKNKQERWKTCQNVEKRWLYNRNLLDYSYHQNYYKFIDIDLSRQTNATIFQEINFTGKLEEDDGATVFLPLKSSKKHSKLSFRFINSSKMI